MAEKKKIPCRVCGKLFEPCAFCQSHNDVFRWRNFACSRECATKYINETIAYRKSLKNKKEKGNSSETKNESVNEEVFNKKPITTRKKINKKYSTVDVDSESKINETE